MFYALEQMKDSYSNFDFELDGDVKNSIGRLIHRCKSLKELSQVHSHVIKLPHLLPNHRSFLTSRLLFCISPLSLSYACKIFSLIQNPTLFSYNAIIRANSTNPTHPSSSASLILYKQLLANGLLPDSITLPFVLKECSTRADLIAGRGVHAHGLKFGYESDVYVQNSLINLYSECGVSEDAHKVFDEMPNRDVVSWNSIIISSLRSGELDAALQLFSAMPERKNIITWNSMITGFVQGGRPKEALEIFRDMQVSVDTVYPDKVTLAGVLSACASLGAINLGRWVHHYIERTGTTCDMVLGTSLVDMYGKCGFIRKAFEVFLGMPEKDVLAWTAMISSYAMHGYGRDAIELYGRMEEAGVRPNAVTFVAILSACAHTGLIDEGRRYFQRMGKHGIEPRVEHYTCMVDILGRAGRFDEAEELIGRMPVSPDVFTWGALLGACRTHGNIRLGEKVARLLIEMEPENHVFYVVLCDLYGKSRRFEDRQRVRSWMNDRRVEKGAPGTSLIEVEGVVLEFSVKGSPEMEMEMPMERLKSVLETLDNEMKVDEKYIETLL
ncbi:pentatricopeptide repeat-containing protein At5g66520-like [Andrographis paniculata]|uniref:pentatricopeptide repeat-containing protein At5g66520-like n=1 Tax=Andrographis paniculata TaxID=175694 RepID=UPI0021E962AA|nr:pentatricopeptide repeat-containing protein At5g66520-like [Andrographis paniculata]